MKMEWFWLAIVSLFAYTFLFLLIKKATDLGGSSGIIYLYSSAFATIITFIYLFSTRTSLQVNKYVLFFLFLAAIFAVIGNLFLIQSIKISPNPGYSLAVSGLDVILIAIASVFIFKSEFTILKIIGVILAIIGVILIGLD